MTPIAMPRADLELGVRLAKRNAKRLATDAQVLLSNHGSRESVYGLWHLSVEELGKAELLRQHGTAPGDPVPVPRSSITDHETKFALGLALLPITKGQPLNQVVRVLTNTATTSRTFLLDDGSSISIPSYTTGEFEDLSQAGWMPAHGLRLRLLYTDYINGSWRDPVQDLRDSEVRAEITLSEHDLREALEELLQVIAS